MEITSILGPVLGLVAVCGTALIKGLPLSALVGASAAMIVGVGTTAAVLGAYPLKDVIFALKSLGLFFNGPNLHTDIAIGEIERLAQLARKDGVLALEKEIEKLDDPFMKKGVEMVSMNIDPPVIEETLFNEISMMYEEEEVAGRFWEDMGAFSPTVGIIGAVLGLMVVMLNLNNPDEIGPGIKAAFIATIYGVGLANLFALPCGKKIKRMCHHKKMYREIVATGVIGIALGTSPKALAERLRGMGGGGH